VSQENTTYALSAMRILPGDLEGAKPNQLPNSKEVFMSAPSKANIGKLGNPARVTANHRHGTEACV